MYCGKHCHKSEDTLPSSKDLNDFFKNNSSKIHLQQFLKAQFTAEAKTLDGNMIYSIQDECCSRVSGKRKELLECNHIEAETIIFYIYAKLRDSWELLSLMQKIQMLLFWLPMLLTKFCVNSIRNSFWLSLNLFIILWLHLSTNAIYIVFLFLRIEEEKSCI